MVASGATSPPLRVLWILSIDPTRAPNGQLTYSLALLRATAAAGADVTVVHLGSRSPDHAGGLPVADGLPIAWRAAGTEHRNRIGSVSSRLPAMAYTAGSQSFRRVLRDELERPWDVVVVDHVQSGWAMGILRGRLDSSTILVHVSHNDESAVRKRVAFSTSGNWISRAVLSLDAWKIATLEQRILRHAVIVTAITEDDAAAFRKRHHALDPVVLRPGYGGERVVEREITAAVPRRALISGSMLWHVKQFDLLALLRIADKRFAAAGAEIVVIGEAPPDFTAEVLRTTTATRMLGRVPSLSEPFSQARLALVSEPHGGGFKLKTLDYVFHRVPMIVQTGSVAGLPLKDGAGLLEFSSIGALIQGALDVLDDFETLNRLQNEAYSRCESDFDLAEPGRRLYAACSDARNDTQGRNDDELVIDLRTDPAADMTPRVTTIG